MVRLWYFFNSHESRWEKEIIPVNAPASSTAITEILASFRAFRINWYLPSNKRIKLPEIPGRIIAQIARAPERNRQHLRRLQWRIDQVRARSSNPIAACVKLYRMMWESFAGECGLIDTMCNAHTTPRGVDNLQPKAKVLSMTGLWEQRKDTE